MQRIKGRVKSVKLSTIRPERCLETSSMKFCNIPLLRVKCAETFYGDAQYRHPDSDHNNKFIKSSGSLCVCPATVNASEFNQNDQYRTRLAAHSLTAFVQVLKIIFKIAHIYCSSGVLPGLFSSGHFL